MNKINIQAFGPIDNANIEFGDLTLLVGPQASGKSLLLELCKLYADGGHIVSTLKGYNYALDNSSRLAECYFGEGLSSIFTENTMINIDGNAVSPQELLTSDDKDNKESVFYWTPTGRLKILPNTPQFRRLAKSKIQIVKRLNFSTTIITNKKN